MDTLKGLKPQKSAVVIKVSDSGNFAKKAGLMGILPGTVVFMRKNCLLKKHLVIFIRGYTLRISKKDAEKIEILKTDPDRSHRLKNYTKHLDFNA